MRRVALLLGCAAALLAGCGSNSRRAVPAPRPTPSTTAPPYSEGQVLGWVTPTLNNGISLVHSLPPGSSDAQLLPAAEELKTASSVAVRELGQTSWAGAAHQAESSLTSTLAQTEALVTSPPSVGFASRLNAYIQSITSELHTLQGRAHK